MKTLLLAFLAVFLGASEGLAQYTDADSRNSTATRIERSYGLKFDPQKFSLSQLLDLESRISTSSRIQRSYGLSFDYRSSSLSALLDIESRLSSSNRIKRSSGLDYDYREFSLSQLLDFESRISTAKRIERSHGVEVDWHSHTLSDLLQHETSARQAAVAFEASAVRPKVVTRKTGVQPQVAEAQGNDSTPCEITGDEVTAPKARVVARISTAAVTYPGTQITTGFSSGGSSANRYYDYTYRPPVGDHYVAPYLRSDGTFVQGHFRTDRDDSFWNNFSSSGNVNPYTGKVGTKTPFGSYGGGSSYVGGYTRKDGTYVSGHYRKGR